MNKFKYIKGTKKQNCIRLLTLFFIMLAHMLYILDFDMQYMFVFATVFIYLIMIPKKLLNPKNLVFGYYFMWYVISPLFANRYKENWPSYGSAANKAFLMCFTTYAIAMLVLDISIDCEVNEKEVVFMQPEVAQSKISKMATFFLFFMGLVPYILKTGGLFNWLSDANGAFFSRRGAGQFYLLFEFSLMVLLFFEGQKRLKGRGKACKYIQRLFYIGFLLIASVFLGSKNITLLMFLILFCDLVLYKNLLSVQMITLVITGVGIFVAGMYTRLGNIMSTFSGAISSILNYFDTFDNLVKVIQDYDGGWLQTFFMPLNWIPLKLGFYIGKPFYDMSVWLTTEYFPDTWYIGQGTTQWPIEADMYLSFHYYLGIPFLAAYFMLVAYLYKKVYTTGGIWKFIYLNEATYILSHLRGGILTYWYWYLIPLYIWLVMRYDKSAKIKITCSV